MHLPSACCNDEVRYANLELALLISWRTILLPHPHHFTLVEQSVSSGTLPAPSSGVSEAVYEVALLLGWKISSMESAVEMLGGGVCLLP